MFPGQRFGPEGCRRRENDFLRLPGAAVLDVAVERVDLPQVPVRIVGPELGLPGVAALDSVLSFGVQPGAFQSLLHRDEGLCVGKAESEVVERSTASDFAGGLEGQDERRVVRLELGIVGTELGRLHSEERPEERDRLRRSATFSER